MSKFKVGDTVCFGAGGVIETGKIVKIRGIFKKEFFIERRSNSKNYLFIKKKKWIFKPLETIKEPVTEREVQND